MSSTLKFWFIGSFYFFRCWRVGRYSWIQRLQNRFAKYCACLYCRLQCRSSFSKIPGGTLAHGRSCKRWFGVRGSSSMGSSLFHVNGLLFRMLVASVITVDSTSSQTTCSFKRALRMLRTDLIILFHGPPMWLKFEPQSLLISEINESPQCINRGVCIQAVCDFHMYGTDR